MVSGAKSLVKESTGYEPTISGRRYPDWLANLVLVKKSGKWRIHIDFTNLN